MLKAFGSGPAVERDKSKARAAQRAPLSAKAGQSSLSQWQRRNAVLNEIQPKIKRRKKEKPLEIYARAAPVPSSVMWTPKKRQLPSTDRKEAGTTGAKQLKTID